MERTSGPDRSASITSALSFSHESPTTSGTRRPNWPPPPSDPPQKPIDNEQLAPLVAAARTGDQQALRDLIAWAMDYLFPAVLTMLYERRAKGTYITETLHTGGPDLAERIRDDAWAITHSACCRMTLRIDTFRGRNAFGRKVQFATWVHAIAQNELRTLLRNRWREQKRYGGSRDVWENEDDTETTTSRGAAPRSVFIESRLRDTLSPASVNPSPERTALGRFESDLVLDALQHAPLTPEQREAVVLFHGYGYRQEQIARMTGVQVGTVKKRIFDGLRKLRTYMKSRHSVDTGEGR